MFKDDCVGPVMEQLLDDLKKPDSVKRVAYHFSGGVGAPCELENLVSRLLVTLHGTYDARSDLQWRAAGRWLKDGATPFHIVVTESEVDGHYPTLRAWPIYRIQDTEGRPARYGIVEPLAVPSPTGLATRWGVKVRCGVFDSNGHCGVPSPALDPHQAATFFWELVRAVKGKTEALKNGDGVRQGIIQDLAAAVLSNVYGVDCGDGSVRDYIYAASTGRYDLNACYAVVCAADRLLKLILGWGDRRTLPWGGMRPIKVGSAAPRCMQYYGYRRSG